MVGTVMTSGLLFSINSTAVRRMLQNHPYIAEHVLATTWCAAITQLDHDSLDPGAGSGKGKAQPPFGVIQ